MSEFYVIIYDFNEEKFKPYDVMPYLRREYYELDEKPFYFDDFKEFVINKCRYKYMARCEYEIILSDWPCQKKFEKCDIYRQIMMNIDIVTQILIDEVTLN